MISSTSIYARNKIKLKKLSIFNSIRHDCNLIVNNNGLSPHLIVLFSFMPKKGKTDKEKR
jgi:hypothetical protein